MNIIKHDTDLESSATVDDNKMVMWLLHLAPVRHGGQDWRTFCSSCGDQSRGHGIRLWLMEKPLNSLLHLWYLIRWFSALGL